MGTLPTIHAEEEKLPWEDYARCVHCGLCLNDCPTYRLWGQEADSPRGRIQQMLQVEYGGRHPDATFVRHIDRCLDCRACESVCPSGVEYGKLVEQARARIEQEFRRSLGGRLARQLFYRHLLPYPGRMASLARWLRRIERTSLPRRIARWTRQPARALPLHLLPPVDSEFFFSRHGLIFPAQGRRRARVALFAGCVTQLTLTSLNEATLRVLQANGCEVVIPAGQWCCGALAVHAGFRDVARALARRVLDTFLPVSCDAIVTHTAGCGSTLKEYARLFPAGSEDHARAGELAQRVRDITEWLDTLGLVAPLDALPLRVTYQDPCHLAHGQRIRQAPRRLLRAIPGLELIEMERSDQCCGSAGVYNLTQAAAAAEILREKMRHIAATEAQTIVTANPGCILQLRAGVALWGENQSVVHVVELLHRALHDPPGGRPAS